MTRSGVPLDSCYSPAGGEDVNWNAVWESNTSYQGTGWVDEMRIPYSAICFSNAQEQLWGINFMRQRKRDNAYNAFNVDAVYSWWFAPGSQVSIVWKNAGSTYLQAEEATPLYFDNFNNTINTPHNNSVSVKVLYYLDYLSFRKKR